MANPLVIDVHVHFFASRREGREQVDSYQGTEFGGPPVPPYCKYDGVLEDVLDNMKVAKASKAIMVHYYLGGLDRYSYVSKLPVAKREQALKDFSAPHKEALKRSNYWACEVLKPHKNLLPYVFVDPWILGPKEAADHLTDLAKHHGAKGIKLHSPSQMFSMGDKRMWPMYETCRDLGLGIIAHSGASVGRTQYGDPKAFMPVLKAFPKLKLVMAHLGNGSWRQTVEVAKANPNAVFDTCELIEWLGRPGSPTREQFAQIIKDVGPHRVMLASDFPWWDTKHVADTVLALPLLSKSEKEGILGANAARFFGF